MNELGRRVARYRTPLVGLIGVLLAALAVALPAGAAAAGSSAACVASWHDAVTPGVTLTPAHATFTSNGETGWIQCVGSVKGNRVTGRGTFGEVGEATGTCMGGTGSATFSMTIPTTAGPVHMEMPAAFRLIGVVGLRPTGSFPGGFVFAPLRGDCVTSPVTEIAVVLHGRLLT